jgi:hypothetical protein
MAILVNDPFTRSVGADGGGTEPQSGLTYGVSVQGSSDLTVDGSRLKGFVNANNNRIRADLGINRSDGRMEMTVRAEAIDKQWEWMLGIRGTDAANGGLCARMVVTTAEVVRGHFRWRNGSTDTDVTTIADVSGAPAFVANTDWRIIFECQSAGGSNKDLRMKIYRLADGEPGSWTFTTTTSSGPDTAGSLFLQMTCSLATSNMFIDDLKFTEFETGYGLGMMGFRG